MTIQVQAAPDGAKGVDTIIPFTHDMAAKVKAAGYSFIVRYLGALSIAEKIAILSAGMGLLVVGYSRRPGWSPNAFLGGSDGAEAVQHAQAVGLPQGMTVYCDLEGPASGTSADDCIAYVNAWAEAVIAAGYIAGLYVGYAVPLTPDQLYHNLKVTAYWHSCSNVQAVSVRGYQMYQQNPPNQKVAGINVDIDEVKVDAKGDTPHWLIDA